VLRVITEGCCFPPVAAPQPVVAVRTTTSSQFSDIACEERPLHKVFKEIINRELSVRTQEMCAWRPVAFWGVYSHAAPSIQPMNHLQLQQQQQPQQHPFQGVFQQVLSGEGLIHDRSHIYIHGTAGQPDASIPQLMQQAQSASSHSSCFLAVDALYKLEPTLCDQLNDFLETKGFGPFQFVSDAVFLLLQLRRRNSSEASELEQQLAAFAQEHSSSLDCLMQWPQLLKMKKLRDEDAHPFDVSLLRQQLASNNPDLLPVKGALQLLLTNASGQSAAPCKSAMLFL